MFHKWLALIFFSSLTDEIKANPTDVRLQTNLLQLYKDWGAEDKNKLNEAYNYGCQVEARKPFSESLEWYKTLFDIMQVRLTYCLPRKI